MFPPSHVDITHVFLLGTGFGLAASLLHLCHALCLSRANVLPNRSSHLSKPALGPCAVDFVFPTLPLGAWFYERVHGRLQCFPIGYVDIGRVRRAHHQSSYLHIYSPSLFCLANSPSLFKHNLNPHQVVSETSQSLRRLGGWTSRPTVY